MTKRDFRSKISLAWEYLAILKRFKKTTEKQLTGSVEIRLAVERALRPLDDLQSREAHRLGALPVPAAVSLVL